jgi:hypothetical protein
MNGRFSCLLSFVQQSRATQIHFGPLKSQALIVPSMSNFDLQLKKIDQLLRQLPSTLEINTGPQIATRRHSLEIQIKSPCPVARNAYRHSAHSLYILPEEDSKEKFRDSGFFEP